MRETMFDFITYKGKVQVKTFTGTLPKEFKDPQEIVELVINHYKIEDIVETVFIMFRGYENGKVVMKEIHSPLNEMIDLNER
jgi:hypothetical protein